MCFVQVLFIPPAIGLNKELLRHVGAHHAVDAFADLLELLFEERFVESHGGKISPQKRVVVKKHSDLIFSNLGDVKNLAEDSWLRSSKSVQDIADDTEDVLVETRGADWIL